MSCAPPSHGVYYNDLRINVARLRPPAAGAPAWTKYADDGVGSRGVYAYMFEKNKDEYLDGGDEFEHDLLEGSDVTGHVHWQVEDGTAGTITLGIEWIWTNPTGIIGLTTVDSTTFAAPGTAGQCGIAAIAAMSGTGKLISSLVGFNVFRLGVTDTYQAGVFIHAVGFHYRNSAPGSRSEYVK